jgi:hypothetical protein
MPISPDQEKAILKACRKENVAASAVEGVKARYEKGLFAADRARSVRAYLQSERQKSPQLFAGPAIKNDKSSNPWSVSNWNVTEQGRLVKALGLEAAAKMAAAQGVTLGATEKHAREAAQKRKLARAYDPLQTLSDPVCCSAQCSRTVPGVE